MNVILAAMGGWGDLEGKIVKTEPRVYPVFGWEMTVVLALLLVVMAVWVCRARGVDVSGGRRAVLVVLRFLALCALVPLLIDLSLRVELRREVKPVLAVAVDTSESMSLVDKESGAAGAARSRLARVKGMLGPEGGALLDSLAQKADLRLFAFDGTARPLGAQDAAAALAKLEATGSFTSLAGGIEEIVDRMAGKPTAGILIFSDGANNTGGSPLPECPRWRQAGVRLHAVAMGDPEPRDVEIRQVLADDLLFQGDPATVIVRVRQRGFDQRRFPIILRRGTEELARVPATFGPGESELNIPVVFTPRRAGEQAYRVECPVQEGETTDRNNHRTFRARVTASKIRVLYVEQQPHWQYRFLRDAATRDGRLKFEILLVGAEPGPQPPPLTGKLPTAAEGFDDIDLLILGDVDPRILTASQMEWIRDWVQEDGGGLVLLAGPHYNPYGYRETPLADLFPVETEGASKAGGRRPRTLDSERFVPELTPLGRSYAAIQLGDTMEENLERWARLPTIFWHAPVLKARPGASVLARHPSAMTSGASQEAMPLLAVQHFGRGKTFYCGFDETWRWRFQQGDQVFYRFWGQVFQYLGAPHLSGGRRRITLKTDRTSYGRGEKALVTIRGEELGEGDLPTVVVEDSEGRQKRYALTTSPGAPHLYEARVPLPEAGPHKIWLEGYELDATAVIDVEAPQKELLDPAANVSLLKELAGSTGGHFAREQSFRDVIDKLDLAARWIDERREFPLWDVPWLVVVFAFLLGVEWALRRLWQLP